MSKKLKPNLNKAENVETKQSDNMQALNFIDSCAALAPLGRPQHIHIQQAVLQISAALGELERMKSRKEKPNET